MKDFTSVKEVPDYLCNQHLPGGSIHAVIYNFIQLPLQSLGGSIWSYLFIGVIASLLWFLGIHGGMVTMGIMVPIWISNDLAPNPH